MQIRAAAKAVTETAAVAKEAENLLLISRILKQRKLRRLKRPKHLRLRQKNLQSLK